jgi:hypothetical protein
MVNVGRRKAKLKTTTKGGTFSLRYQKHQILKLCTRLDVEGRQVAYIHYFKFDTRSYK